MKYPISNLPAYFESNSDYAVEEILDEARRLMNPDYST